MKRLTILVLILIAATACAPSQSGSLGPGYEPTLPTRIPTPAPAESQTPTKTATLTIQVWFQRDGKLFATARTRPLTQNTSHLALTELIAGPSTVEHLETSLPSDTRFDIKGIADGTAVVSFPASFYAGTVMDRRIRLAQLVYTLTQFRSVSRVAFLSDGQPIIGEPLGRADFENLLPRIVVYRPTIGQQVTSPVTVSGIADVYESTVSVRVLDSGGNEVGAKFTTALCNTYCHGGYSVAVPYKSCDQGTGTVQVYMSSPQDGSRQDVVSIPVQFAACV
jgi:hypothetical protein